MENEGNGRPRQSRLRCSIVELALPAGISLEHLRSGPVLRRCQAVSTSMCDTRLFERQLFTASASSKVARRQLLRSSRTRRITSDRKEIDKMRASLRLIVTLSLLMVGAPHAYAQRRVPETGMWGLGGSIGAGVPSDPSLANGFEFAGNLERYVTPRVSIRGQL